MPKKGQGSSPETVLDPLYYALSRYSQDNPLPKFRECVVCFSHVYDGGMPGNRVRDHDSLQQKQVLDVISAFVMVDDGGLLCDAYNTAEVGGEDRTEILVMERGRFREWLGKRQGGAGNISDF
jgi:hypothetical protein